LPTGLSTARRGGLRRSLKTVLSSRTCGGPRVNQKSAPANAQSDPLPKSASRLHPRQHGRSKKPRTFYFNAALQCVNASPPPCSQPKKASFQGHFGTAPQTVNATIALTIAKAEAQYAEILAAIREAEATITKLTEASTATRLNQPLALTVRQAEQINNIFIFVQQQPAVPTQQPATEVQHAPAKLNSFVDHLKKYLDNFFTEGSKSAGKKLGNTIAYGAIVYLLKDQLTALMNHISDWLNTIAALLH